MRGPPFDVIPFFAQRIFDANIFDVGTPFERLCSQRKRVSFYFIFVKHSEKGRRTTQISIVDIDANGLRIHREGGMGCFPKNVLDP